MIDAEIRNLLREVSPADATSAIYFAIRYIKQFDDNVEKDTYLDDAESLPPENIQNLSKLIVDIIRNDPLFGKFPLTGSDLRTVIISLNDIIDDIEGDLSDEDIENARSMIDTLDTPQTK